MRAVPGAPLIFWVGRRTRPFLAPLALRDRPVPSAARVALVAGGLVATATVLFRPARRRPR